LVVLAQMETVTVVQAVGLSPKAVKTTQLCVCFLMLVATRKFSPWANPLLLRLATVSGLLVQQVSLVHTHTDFCLPHFLHLGPNYKVSGLQV
jgi:hypothetical protein